MKVLGLDLGLDLGWTVLDFTTPSIAPMFVATGIIEIGTNALMAKPRVTKAGTQTHERIVTDNDLEFATKAIDSLISQYIPGKEFGEGFGLVCAERIKKVAARENFGPDMATNLCLAENIGGIPRGLCFSRGVQFMTCTAGEARRSIVGKRNASDSEIGQIIGSLVKGWPKRSNADKRDAGFVALHCYRVSRTKVNVEQVGGGCRLAQFHKFIRADVRCSCGHEGTA
jgi:hypothetical protein